MTKKEFEWWSEHYPHEAETIATMCDLFDTSQDWAIKAQLDYVIGLLKEKEEYREHDLIENPNDLPKEDGWYYCWLKNSNINYGMDLYFYTKTKQFIDNRRKDVFQLYDVLAYDSNTFKKQIYTDDLVNRTKDVVGWRKIKEMHR